MPTLPRPASAPRHLPSLRRVRRRLGSRRWWVLAALAALLAGATVARLTNEAAAQAARWGAGRQVMVATRSLDAGAEIGPGDVELVERPTAMVPATPAEDPLGRRLSHPVLAGEVVVEERLAPAGSGAVAARLPAATVGLAVPHDGRGLRLAVGDHVDVLATFEPEAAGSADPTFPVARAAQVVDVTDEGVTVAVQEEDAPRVAYALAVAIVTLALVK